MVLGSHGMRLARAAVSLFHEHLSNQRKTCRVHLRLQGEACGCKGKLWRGNYAGKSSGGDSFVDDQSFDWLLHPSLLLLMDLCDLLGIHLQVTDGATM